MSVVQSQLCRHDFDMAKNNQNYFTLLTDLKNVFISVAPNGQNGPDLARTGPNMVCDGWDQL